MKWITNRWLSCGSLVVACLIEIAYQGSFARAEREAPDIEVPVKTLTPNDYLHKAIDAQLELENAKRKFAVAAQPTAVD